ncbi:hypothetical protein JCM10213_008887 [Rhodosporidiobolus nylandii]
MAADTVPHPFSAASNGWAPPDFSREARRPRTSTTSFTAVEVRFPPDEEKGRSFRSSSQTASTSTLFASALPQSTSPAAVVQPQAGAGLLPSLFQDDDGGEDDMLDDWLAEGGAKGKQAEDADGDVDELAAEAERVSFMPTRELPSRPGVDWTAVLDTAVMKANGQIDLSSRGLTEIPGSIAELETLRSISSSRTFERIQSVPASPTSPYRSPRRPFGRIASGPLSPSPTAAKTAVSLTLSFANNELTEGSISNALWSLPNLLCLSLRHNHLEHLPEGVGRLSGLKELNVANNFQMKFLPAELLQLDLASLFLHPNRFLPSPSCATSSTSSLDNIMSAKKRVLGPLITHYTVPSLFETCIRRLLSPLAPTSPLLAIAQYDRSDLKQSLSPSLLEPFLGVLTPAGGLPPSTSSHLSSPSAFSRARHSSSPAAPPKQPFDPLSHICRSPAHDGEEKVFYTPAVERLEWVSERALQPAAAEPEKKSDERCIPIRWRGCGARCLDWLEEEIEEDGEEQVDVEECCSRL